MSDLLRSVAKPQNPNPKSTTLSIRLLKWRPHRPEDLELE